MFYEIRDEDFAILAAGDQFPGVLKELKLCHWGGLFVRVLFESEVLSEVDGSSAVFEAEGEMGRLGRGDGSGSDGVEGFVAEVRGFLVDEGSVEGLFVLLLEFGDMISGHQCLTM